MLVAKRRIQQAPKQMPSDWQGSYSLPLISFEGKADVVVDDTEKENQILELQNPRIAKGWATHSLKKKGIDAKEAIALLGIALQQSPDSRVMSAKNLNKCLAGCLFRKNGKPYSKYPDLTQKAVKILEEIYPGFIKRETNGARAMKFGPSLPDELLPVNDEDVVAALIYGVLSESLVNTPTTLTLSEDGKTISDRTDTFQIPDSFEVYGRQVSLPKPAVLIELFPKVQAQCEGSKPQERELLDLFDAVGGGSTPTPPVYGSASAKHRASKKGKGKPVNSAALREKSRRDYDLSYVTGSPSVCAQGIVDTSQNYSTSMPSSIKADLDGVITAISRPHLDKRQIYRLSEQAAKRKNGKCNAYMLKLLNESGCRGLTGIKDHPMYEELAMRYGLQSSVNANMILVQALSGCEGEIFCVAESDLVPTTLRELTPKPKFRFAVPLEETWREQ